MLAIVARHYYNANEIKYIGGSTLEYNNII
jgi:hypothetical protein